ncbi:hypothetical protein HJG60_011922 [Phyllostomus discolor]|uniref:Uncharacterized protein n=1 Tax=Phyllostomus discolor TaxID=89673 RepID=A0A833ZEA7_9CHIR|nr:hypothetical protein HJG60_011922 [Phyllostomus discolor]
MFAEDGREQRVPPSSPTIRPMTLQFFPGIKRIIRNQKPHSAIPTYITHPPHYPCSDRCSPVGWASSCKPKSHRFDSWSEHKPGLQARSLVGGVPEATEIDISVAHPCLSPSFSLSSPLLTIDK